MGLISFNPTLSSSTTVSSGLECGIKIQTIYTFITSTFGYDSQDGQKKASASAMGLTLCVSAGKGAAAAALGAS